MKTQLRKPARDRARYSEEYKKEALELCQANHSTHESKSGRSVEELEAEIHRLRVENAKLLEQREVLKKSLGILSETPPRSMPESSR